MLTHVGSHDAWVARSRVVLTPIAAPSILGLFGFASATFMVAANEAWGYGGSDAALFLAPLAATFGGLAQFTAGVLAFRARDGVATAMHGMWGSFWPAYGILDILFAVGALTEPSGRFPESATGSSRCRRSRSPARSPHGSRTSRCPPCC